MTRKPMRLAQLPLLGSNQDSPDPETVARGPEEAYNGDSRAQMVPAPSRSAPEAPTISPTIDRDVVCVALDRAFNEVPIGSSLTAESIRDRLSFTVREQLAVPTRRNVMGAWFRRLAKSGRVQADGFTEAQRDDARHRALRRWRRVA